MMNMLFIYPKPDIIKFTRFGFSLNIAYASSILKQRNNRVFIIDLSVEKTMTYADIIQFIVKNKIDIVAIEIDSYALKRSSNIESSMKLIKYLKENYKNYVVAFGHYCAMNKNIPCVDKILHYDIVKYLMLHPHTNFVNDGERIDRFEFDSIPFPDRDGIEKIKFYGNNKHSTLIKTSEGCLNTCTFCQRHGWQKEYNAHSIEYVCHEFESLKDRGYKNVWIQDENFTFSLVRAKEILRKLLKMNVTDDMNISISSWSKIDDEFLELAAKANIKTISMGIESANKEVLDFYNKSIDLDDVKRLIDKAHRIGIFVVGNFIIGAPDEDEKMIKNTLNFIENAKIDQVNIKILDYMLGSELYDELDRKKYPNDHYFCCLENGLGKMSLKELKKLKYDFLESYYKLNAKRLNDKIAKYGVPYEKIIFD